MDSVTKAQASGSSSVFELHEVERLDDFANQGITTPVLKKMITSIYFLMILAYVFYYTYI